MGNSKLKLALLPLLFCHNLLWGEGASKLRGYLSCKPPLTVPHEIIGHVELAAKFVTTLNHHVDVEAFCVSMSGSYPLNLCAISLFKLLGEAPNIRNVVINPIRDWKDSAVMKLIVCPILHNLLGACLLHFGGECLRPIPVNIPGVSISPAHMAGGNNDGGSC